MGEGLLDFLQFAARAQWAYRQSDRQTDRYANLLVCNWKAAKKSQITFHQIRGTEGEKSRQKSRFRISHTSKCSGIPCFENHDTV